MVTSLPAPDKRERSSKTSGERSRSTDGRPDGNDEGGSPAEAAEAAAAGGGGGGAGRPGRGRARVGARARGHGGGAPRRAGHPSGGRARKRRVRRCRPEGH